MYSESIEAVVITELVLEHDGQIAEHCGKRAERKGAHTPREAPGEDYDKDKDYQLERALDLLRAGGDISRLSAPAEGIVVTEPGSEPKPDVTPADEPETPDEQE